MDFFLFYFHISSQKSSATHSSCTVSLVAELAVGISFGSR